MSLWVWDALLLPLGKEQEKSWEQWQWVLLGQQWWQPGRLWQHKAHPATWYYSLSVTHQLSYIVFNHEFWASRGRAFCVSWMQQHITYLATANNSAPYRLPKGASRRGNGGSHFNLHSTQAICSQWCGSPPVQVIFGTKLWPFIKHSWNMLDGICAQTL